MFIIFYENFQNFFLFSIFSNVLTESAKFVTWKLQKKKIEKKKGVSNTCRLFEIRNLKKFALLFRSMISNLSVNAFFSFWAICGVFWRYHRINRNAIDSITFICSHRTITRKCLAGRWITSVSPSKTSAKVLITCSLLSLTVLIAFNSYLVLMLFGQNSGIMWQIVLNLVFYFSRQVTVKRC